MRPTPICEYFPDNFSKSLRKIYAINSMERLIELCEDKEYLNDIADVIGFEKDHLKLIIEKAKKNLTPYPHSGRRYPTGALIR